MADGGWVRLEENVNYNTVYGECSYTGRSISRNGITYTLYGGYNSWSGASSWFSDGIDFNGGTDVRKHLAIVHNDAEQKIIEQLLNATSTVDKAWIGTSKNGNSWATARFRRSLRRMLSSSPVSAATRGSGRRSRASRTARRTPSKISGRRLPIRAVCTRFRGKNSGFAQKIRPIPLDKPLSLCYNIHV